MLAGWGRLAVPGHEVLAEDLAAATRDAVLTRGLGRSYGDASLPPPGVLEVVGSRRADRILAFDGQAGVLRAEAGLSLHELVRLLLPRGWFVPVSPGTQHVTLGGMVAADVHGKNHHRAGTFGAHVTALRVRLAGGRIVECSPRRQKALFQATVGGMGLTGHILEVEHRLERLPSPWIACRTSLHATLEETAEALLASRELPFTAAWLDGVGGGARSGRGVVLAGRWAAREEAPREPPRQPRPVAVPFPAPEALLNRLTVGLFNRLYRWRQGTRPAEAVVSPFAFFYPLDAVGGWNRLYGRRGMTQYQCVIPQEAGIAGLRRFWDLMRESGGRPYLVVLKDFGAEGTGLLSFPRPGWTLALDFPAEPGTRRLVATLNAFLATVGGRFYLAKDAFSTAAELAACEGERLARFQEARRRWDPQGHLRSRLSVRLLEDDAGPAEEEGA